MHDTIQAVKCECGLHPLLERYFTDRQWMTSAGCKACGVIAVTADNMSAAVGTWNRIQHGLKALAAIPDPRKVLRERLLRLIKTRDEVSEGVLVNLVRPIKPDVMKRELEHLMQDCHISGWERENPRNKKMHVIYRYEQE